MKTSRNTLEFKYLFLLITITLAALSSCKKDNDNQTNGQASIMVTNSAEGSAAQDLMLDNATVSGSTVAYTQSSNYLNVKSGDHQAKFVNSGSATANAAFNLSLQAGQHYSIYYTGDASTSSSSYLVTQDDLSAPASGKAKVRFVHLSSAATSTIDLGIATGNKIITGLAYRAASAYYTVDANTTFLLYASGSSTASLSIPTTVQAGKIYTIYVSGATSATVTYHVVAQN